MAPETYTIRFDVGDSTDEFDLPVDAIDLLTEEEETPAEAVGNLALLSLAQQLHGAVHHSHGEPDEAVADAESAVMDVFEDRFGTSFGELTGHDH